MVLALRAEGDQLAGTVSIGNMHAISTKTWNGPDTKPAVLYAFDATKLGSTLYASERNSQRDRAALATRFAIPLVVNDTSTSVRVAKLKSTDC
ncbi:MAG TPA: hypothetical protein VMP68_22130 [Candidatus Eisenbacteria bacterium]|nr:hypothetical protein [Candidatus Eisenbacteria bacterium]